MAVDAKTRLILYKLVNGGTLESVEGVVSSGKESVVFHGTGGRYDNIHGNCILSLKNLYKGVFTVDEIFKNKEQNIGVNLSA